MTVFDAALSLVGNLEGDVLEEEQLARYVGLKTGGACDLLIRVASQRDLEQSLAVLSTTQVPWVVLGKGNGVLVSRDGYRGAVIVLGRAFRQVEVDLKARIIKAGAGAQVAQVVQAAHEYSLGGLEFLAGIPGTVGGAVSLNVTSNADPHHLRAIGEMVKTVVTYAPQKGYTTYDTVDIDWYYHCSTLDPHEVIVEVHFELEQKDQDEIKVQMQRELEYRAAHYPLHEAAVGEVFRATTTPALAELLHEAEVYGMRVGGARLSDQNLNMIIGTSDVTADDVVTLMMLVRQRVESSHGVRLKPEIKFLGFIQ